MTSTGRWEVGDLVTYTHYSGWTLPAMVLRNRRLHPLGYEYEALLDDGQLLPCAAHELSRGHLS